MRSRAPVARLGCPGTRVFRGTVTVLGVVFRGLGAIGTERLEDERVVGCVEVLGFDTGRRSDCVDGRVGVLFAEDGLLGARVDELPVGRAGALRVEEEGLLGARVDELPVGRACPRDPLELGRGLEGLLVCGRGFGPDDDRVPEERDVDRVVDFVDLSPLFLSPERACTLTTSDNDSFASAVDTDVSAKHSDTTRNIESPKSCAQDEQWMCSIQY